MLMPSKNQTYINVLFLMFKFTSITLLINYQSWTLTEKVFLLNLAIFDIELSIKETFEGSNFT